MQSGTNCKALRMCVSLNNIYGLSCLQCTSQNKTRVSLSQKQVFNYKVKIINQKKKSMYTMKPLLKNSQFSTLTDLRECVKEEAGQFRGALGYVEPGHGTKGKLRQLNDDEDLAEMYVVHNRKRDVLLWCYGDVGEGSSASSESRKRPPTDTPTPASKQECIAKTISNVETIIEKLKEKHGENGYPVEQFNCWAHMINSGKWSSYDAPPDLPFFKKPKDKEKPIEKESDMPEKSSCSTAASVANSPTKRLNLRMQCIDQLSKWHVLLESGAINKSQYEELKGTILEDIKHM